MQSKYLGDKGDFAKFGLLRLLLGLTDPEADTPPLSLGVVWYLVPDECCKGDGRVLGFLRDIPTNRRTYRVCDPELWDTLKDIVECGRRCVHQLPTTRIFPQGTLYYDKLLHYPHGSRQPMKQEIRRLWFEGALRATEGADVALLDPDNGATPNEREMYRQKGPKFAYPEDLHAFWGRGQSIALYQHLGMNVPAEQFIRDRSMQIREALRVRETFALRFGSRVFFVIPQPIDEGYIRARVGRLVRSPWGGHFQLVEVPSA